MTDNALAFGIITDDDAWELLLKVADLVHELFPSFDDFHESYRLGNTYWSQNADMTEERLSNFQRYKNSCDWPIAK